MNLPINTAKDVSNTITTRYRDGRAIDYYSGGGDLPTDKHPDGLCPTIESHYHKAGTYNFLTARDGHKAMAIMIIYEYD